MNENQSVALSHPSQNEANPTALAVTGSNNNNAQNQNQNQNQNEDPQSNVEIESVQNRIPNIVLTFDFAEEVREYARAYQELRAKAQASPEVQSPRKFAEEIVISSMRAGGSKYMELIQFLLINPVRSNADLYSEGLKIEKRLWSPEVANRLVTYLMKAAIAAVKLELLNFYEKIDDEFLNKENLILNDYQTLFFGYTAYLSEGLNELFDYHIRNQMDEFNYTNEKKNEVLVQFLDECSKILPLSYHAANDQIRRNFYLGGPCEGFTLIETLKGLRHSLSAQKRKTLDIIADVVDYRRYLLGNIDAEWNDHQKKVSLYLQKKAETIMSNGAKGIPIFFRDRIANVEALNKLRGLVAVETVEEMTGSNLVLLSVLYGNKNLYKVLDNRFSANKQKMNKKDLCASFYYDQIYSKNLKLENNKYDCDGEILRKLEKDIFHYLETWHLEKDTIKQLKESENIYGKLKIFFKAFFQDGPNIAFMSFSEAMSNDGLHSRRGAEATAYLKIIIEAASKKTPVDFYHKLMVLVEKHKPGFFKKGSRLIKNINKSIATIDKYDDRLLLKASNPALIKELEETRSQLRNAKDKIERLVEALETQKASTERATQEATEAQQTATDATNQANLAIQETNEVKDQLQTSKQETAALNARLLKSEKELEQIKAILSKMGINIGAQEEGAEQEKKNGNHH